MNFALHIFFVGSPRSIEPVTTGDVNTMDADVEIKASKEALVVERKKHNEMKENWAREKSVLEEKVRELEERNKFLHEQLEQQRGEDNIITLQKSNLKDLEANTIATLHQSDEHKSMESRDANVETTSDTATQENKALKSAEDQDILVESAELSSSAMKETDKMSTMRPPAISLTSTSKSLLKPSAGTINAGIKMTSTVSSSNKPKPLI